MKILQVILYSKSIGLVIRGLIFSLAVIFPSSAIAEKTLGIAAHLHQASHDQVIEQLDLAQELGVTAIRMDVPWSMVENAAGVLSVPATWDTLVEETQQRGIHCLFILDYGHPSHRNGSKPVNSADIEAFSRYAEFIVQHFHGKVSSYELWNEWDMNTCGSTPGNAQEYLRLVRTVYPRLKAVDAEATILAGGASGLSYGNEFSKRYPALNFGRSSFFSEILSNGILNYIDGLSVHIYVYWKEGATRTHEGALAVLDGILEAIRRNQPNKTIPIHVTEVGWPTTYKGARVFSTPQEQADFLGAFTEQALSRNEVASVFIYELKDGNGHIGDIEGNFGLFDVSGQKKPAFLAIAKSAIQIRKFQNK